MMKRHEELFHYLKRHGYDEQKIIIIPKQQWLSIVHKMSGSGFDGLKSKMHDLYQIKLTWEYADNYVTATKI